MEKDFQVFQETKNDQLCSTANSKCSFQSLNISLRKNNCFKIQAISLVSKSIYFSRGYLCFIAFAL